MAAMSLHVPPHATSPLASSESRGRIDGEGSAHGADRPWSWGGLMDLGSWSLTQIHLTDADCFAVKLRAVKLTGKIPKTQASFPH
eukprot:COSAG01_NODE_44435_length_419_cov_0.871875_1_plen_85_part_00